MISFSTNAQINNQPLNKPSITAVASQVLRTPQTPPNTPIKSFAELKEQFAN